MDHRRRRNLAAWLCTAAFVCLGCEDTPRIIVFEGTLPAHLTFDAVASLVTRDGAFYCRKNWFTVPGPHTARVEGKLERVPKERYRFVIDLSKAELGGLCSWGLSMVVAGVGNVGDSGYSHSGVAKLNPNRSQRPSPPLPDVLEVECRPYPQASGTGEVRCEPYRTLEVDSFSGDTHIELNVRWDPTPWYPPEWDTYPEYRPDGWEPGMPMPPPTL